MRLRLTALVLLVVALSGCGGSSSPPESEGQVTLPEETLAPILDYRLEGWSETDFSKRVVELDEFQSGGPPKDGIPPIDTPRFAPVAETEYIDDREPVIELVVDGEARAYPIQILIWHEIVNDEVAGVPVAVTFCPLCNTAIVFDRRLDGRTLDFGTTGKLRNSDLVMYDRQTESWWQQFGGDGLVGHYAGEELEQLPARIVSWEQFRREHPDALVLTRDTGNDRDYGRNPYEGYDDVDSPPFFEVAGGDDDRLPPKERVVLIESGDEAVVVPYSVLRKRERLEVELDGRTFEVSFRQDVASALDDAEIAESADAGAAEVREDGELVPFDEPFWFAVAAFRPDARIIR